MGIKKKRNPVFSEKEDVTKKDIKCCNNVSLQEVRNKYPAGLPISTIEITYCQNCGQIHNVTW